MLSKGKLLVMLGTMCLDDDTNSNNYIYINVERSHSSCVAAAILCQANLSK